MGLTTFMELEAIRAQVAHIIKNELNDDPREEIVNPSAERIHTMINDVSEFIANNQHREDLQLIVFDRLIHTLMMQDAMIELMSARLGI